MGFQEYRKYLVWVVVVIFTVSQLILLPVAYFYPREEPTVSFAIWFFPWICALIFSLVFAISLIRERYRKKKQIRINEQDIKLPSSPNALTSMSLEQTRILFESLTKMKPEQIATTLNCLTGMVQNAKTNQKTKEATKTNRKAKAKKKRQKGGKT